MPGSNKDLFRKLEKRGYTPTEISQILNSNRGRAKKPPKTLRSRADERREVRDAQRKIDQEWRDRQDRDIAIWQAQQAEREAETYRRLNPPSDSAHKPSTPDPLTTGTTRATGATAKAVSRQRAITKFEYDQLDRRTDR